MDEQMIFKDIPGQGINRNGKPEIVPYARIPTFLIRCQTITNRAKVLLMYVLTLPENFVLNETHLAKEMKTTEREIAKDIESLIQLGYWNKCRIMRNGRLWRNEHRVYAHPRNPQSFITRKNVSETEVSEYRQTSDGKNALVLTRAITSAERERYYGIPQNKTFKSISITDKEQSIAEQA